MHSMWKIAYGVWALELRGLLGIAGAEGRSRSGSTPQ